MTFEQRLALRADEMRRVSKGDWRQGQCLFNALREIDPLLADMIHSTNADCFYQDSRIPMFWETLLGANK